MVYVKSPEPYQCSLTGFTGVGLFGSLRSSCYRKNQMATGDRFTTKPFQNRARKFVSAECKFSHGQTIRGRGRTNERVTASPTPIPNGVPEHVKRDKFLLLDGALAAVLVHLIRVLCIRAQWRIQRVITIPSSLKIFNT
jgi:hypothetical protein